ncbi:tRNA (adenine(37)-N6)-methyltransferase-like [Ylistrum balloti]|uniref:tRNA (adenine(37)-N6)-methyltransferase-like n=1 Tax=Ylistrum balloti TaxID=509963 RepID=UPI002905D8F5|nr:tRNA (adenine(37)-N6)-methyltransferase-like [Ylistrum balloti]
MKHIGVVNSLFTYKNGTPRQPSVCDTARGSITISKEIFNNPEHSLDGIQQYSHIWIIFEFNKNNNQYTKAKVTPPRLDGRRVGLFSTRSPYRPNPIGLTLAKLERVEGATLHISGIDTLNGTLVLDIKPYIPSYDCPRSSLLLATPTTCMGNKDQPSDISDDQVCDKDPLIDDHNSLQSVDGARPLLNNQEPKFDNTLDICSTKAEKTCIQNEIKIQGEVVNNELTPANQANDTAIALSSDAIANNVPIKASTNLNDSEEISIATSKCDSKSSVTSSAIKTADWVNKPPIEKLTVRFTPTAEQQLAHFSKNTEDSDHRLEFLESCNEARNAICQILVEDPRSVYRRQNCPDRLYFFVVDKVHVTCWFDDGMVEVVRIKPVSQVKHLQPE